MGKKFDIIMAGVVSGIVAITTTFLGLAGTIIGTVLGSIIYQSLSTYVKESLNQRTHNNKIKINNLQLLEDKIVFIIPLILIIIIELSFLYSIFYNNSTFNHLERLTNNNLFKAISIGLFALGLYSIFQPKKIKYQYGISLLILSIFFLIRGILDTNIPYIQQLIYPLIDFLLNYDAIIAILIILILVYITIKLFYDSLKIYLNENLENNKIDNNLNKSRINNINSFHKGISKYNENPKNEFNKNRKNYNKINESSHKINESYSKKDHSNNISKDEKILIENIGKHS
ncbi:MAG: hypothetical protein LBT66_05935 [Methanobrevibacter sp.]|jgi:divalent metal cation (Fe/Co/Zn/Cd) transporter|nr:hypothetical protein [Candidatus Methanovirga meridionalis]